jgi:hypothetical protein
MVLLVLSYRMRIVQSLPHEFHLSYSYSYFTFILLQQVPYWLIFIISDFSYQQRVSLAAACLFVIVYYILNLATFYYSPSAENMFLSCWEVLSFALYMRWKFIGFRFWLKSYDNNRYFVWRLTYICVHRSYWVGNHQAALVACETMWGNLLWLHYQPVSQALTSSELSCHQCHLQRTNSDKHTTVITLTIHFLTRSNWAEIGLQPRGSHVHSVVGLEDVLCSCIPADESVMQL